MQFSPGSGGYAIISLTKATTEIPLNFDVNIESHIHRRQIEATLPLIIEVTMHQAVSCSGADLVYLILYDFVNLLRDCNERCSKERVGACFSSVASLDSDERNIDVCRKAPLTYRLRQADTSQAATLLSVARLEAVISPPEVTKSLACGR